MSYDNMAAAADKWLRQDGSVSTMAGEQVLPPDHARAILYENMTPNAAKWLLPDGSVLNELPVSGGGSGAITGETVKRQTLYTALCTTASMTTKKELTGLPNDYVPLRGDFLIVQFTIANFSSNCTFAFSSDATAYTIKFNGLGTNMTASAWKANSVLPFYFDGTYFHQLCYAKETDDNTFYESGIFEQHLGPMKLWINADRSIVKYHLALERADGSYDGACIVTGPSVSKTKEVNTFTDFKVDGMMWFYIGTRNLSKNTLQSENASCMLQIGQSSTFFNYALNGTENLKSNYWVYLVGIPQDDPLVFRLDPTGPTSWYTTDKPTADDGKIYIRLGYYSDIYFNLFAQHPAYWFKNGYFRPYLTT